MRCVFLFVVIGLPLIARAAEHGPVFGLATPTNSKGEWNFDEGVFTRTSDLGSQASVRELVGYGFTPHLMLSVTLPVVLGDTRLPPTRIQPGADFDSTVAWRFQHRATKIGTRIESTAFAGLACPGPQSGFKGVAHTTNLPGTMIGAVIGLASLRIALGFGRYLRDRLLCRVRAWADLNEAGITEGSRKDRRIAQLETGLRFRVSYG